MSYTVLARRYRSQSFDEVVGQEAIARTLRNAIEQDRVAHAYLFVGTRGVGKTTMARLLAKALNGGDPEVEAAIMSGQDTDVIEIDAASNRGVDEARDLIANCIYRPMRGSYKIYIIDEVHMLTREAFNALLKTMEEPPSHVKFILCTTEPHKVPPTIQSRCQRFDFRNIPTDEIGGHLAAVIESEQMKADPELVRTVARMAAGSMRDGLSLLDRLMAAAPDGGTLTVDLLEKLLGLPARDVLLSLIEALADSDAGTALHRAADLLSRGVSQDQVIDSLVDTLRDLMVLSACGGETDLVDLAGSSREQAVELAQRFQPAGLIHMIGLCESVARMSKSSANPRALFDAMIVRLAMTEQVADVAGLLRQGGGAPVRPVPSQKPSQKKSDGPRPLSDASPPAREPSAAPGATGGAGAGDDDRWRRICDAASTRTTLRVLVQSLRPVSIDDEKAVLTTEDPRQLAYAKSQTAQLATLAEQALGKPVRIELVDDEAMPETTASATTDPVLEHEIVRKAISLFDARVIAVERDEDSADRSEE